MSTIILPDFPFKLMHIGECILGNVKKKKSLLLDFGLFPYICYFKTTLYYISPKRKEIPNPLIVSLGYICIVELLSQCYAHFFTDFFFNI